MTYPKVIEELRQREHRSGADRRVGSPDRAEHGQRSDDLVTDLTKGSVRLTVCLAQRRLVMSDTAATSVAFPTSIHPM